VMGFVGLGAIASGQGQAVPLLICGSMVGAIAAFLLYNMPLQFNHAVRTFMGDAGSTLLGFLFASVALLVVQPSGHEVPPVLILWLIPIPIFELFASTARRVLKGLSPAQADNGHFHHVLLRAGFSVRLICAIYVLFSGLCAYTGWRAYHAGVSEALLCGGFCGLFGLWLLFMASARLVVARLPLALRRG